MNISHQGTSNGLREGDWVCFNCNNLNFSFRKKCNRCKMQTKEQNDSIQTYYYPISMQFPSLGCETVDPVCLSSSFESCSSSSIEEVVSPTLTYTDKVYTNQENEQLSLTCGSLDWHLFLSQNEDEVYLTDFDN